MKHATFVIALFITLTMSVIASAQELTPEEKADGFVSIFNGENLDGWNGAITDNGYIAEDGMLVCQKGGNLYTDEDYADFVYRLEFRLPEGGNNGVGVRVPKGGHASTAGMEIQVLDDYADRYKKLKPYQYCGSVYGIIPAKRGSLKKAGQWNAMEIRYEGRNVRITLNGTVVVEGDLDEHLPAMDGKNHPGAKRTSGRLSFCGHGARVEFRNLRVKRLGVTGQE